MTPKTRVLYVEDDPEWQQIIQGGVSSLGYRLDFASSSKEAMEKIRRTTYHVALLDKRLAENDPENQDGLAFAEVVAGLNEGTNIIIYTSYGDDEDMRNAFRKVKVWDFVGKHKSVTEIVKSIREAAADAETHFNRPTRRMPLEILAFSETTSHQFLQYISTNVSSLITHQSLDIFAKYLLSEYRPLLTDKNSATLINVSEFKILQARFWSKALGMPIAVWLGKNSEMKVALEEVETDKQLKESLGINRKEAEVLTYEALPLLGGAVYELANAEFDEFEAQTIFR
ncbi:MAG TPA: response regulator [Anaerolineales bacterium]|nr:response regulator [Anaerolineales bacterium]HNQ93762.1 response regulator [Anaerolineales bacterium]HNS60519.1 response regulator [Anaerolineales bacterium]